MLKYTVYSALQHWEGIYPVTVEAATEYRSKMTLKQEKGGQGEHKLLFRWNNRNVW